MAVLSLLDVPNQFRAAMSKELSEIFIRCTFAEQEGYRNFQDENMENAGFALNVLQKRLKFHNVEVSFPAALLICSLSSSPGNLVMWAYTCRQIQKKTNRPVTVTDLADYFPWGFPTEQGYSEIWDGQKGRNHGHPEWDNMLDQVETWA